MFKWVCLNGCGYMGVFKWVWLYVVLTSEVIHENKYKSKMEALQGCQLCTINVLYTRTKLHDSSYIPRLVPQKIII